MKNLWVALGAVGFISAAAFIVLMVLAFAGVVPASEPLAISCGVMLLVVGIFDLRSAIDRSAVAALGTWKSSNVKVGRFSTFAMGIGFCLIGVAALFSQGLSEQVNIAIFVAVVGSFALTWYGSSMDFGRARAQETPNNPDQQGVR